MTDERKSQFYTVAFKDIETAKKLMQMSPAEVSEYLANEGYEYSEDEIKVIGNELQEKLAELEAKGELSADELEDVAGGKGEFSAGVALGMLIGVAFLGGW